MTDIVCFWDASTRLFILYAVDAEGNQLWDTQYYPNRSQLAYALAHF